MSLSVTYWFGALLGSLAYFLLAKHRRRAFNSLAVAFPGKDKRTLSTIAKKCFSFMAQSAFELIYFHQNPRAIEQNVNVENSEVLDNCLKRGHGVVAVTAHLGNFPLLPWKLNSLGYRVSIVARPMCNQQAGDYVFGLAQEAGIRIIFSYPRKQCIHNMLKALRNNEIIIVLMDQNFGTGGVWVNFFGKLAATPIGPVVLAMRAKASLLPLSVVRTAMGKHCIKFYPPISLKTNIKNKDKFILKTVKSISSVIEGWIRQNPQQWPWIHRRWKSRPSPKIKKKKFKIQKD
jgi:KDO2-lipid IV(A) lauroyltransferase